MRGEREGERGCGQTAAERERRRGQAGRRRRWRAGQFQTAVNGARPPPGSCQRPPLHAGRVSEPRLRSGPSALPLPRFTTWTRDRPVSADGCGIRAGLDCREDGGSSFLTRGTAGSALGHCARFLKSGEPGSRRPELSFRVRYSVSQPHPQGLRIHSR